MGLGVVITHCPADSWRRGNVITMSREIKRATTPVVCNEVIKDVGRGYWDTYRRALEYGLRNPDVSHLLTLEDDVLLCGGFIEGVKLIVGAKPDSPVSLFYASRHALLAKEQDARWINITFLWGQGVVWPRAFLEGMLRWQKNALKASYSGVSWRQALYITKHKIPAFATAPSLVDHLRPQNSMLGYRTPQPRVARWHIGSGLPSDYDWSNQKEIPGERPSFSTFVKRWKLENEFVNPAEGQRNG
jgi:hypothetical protein